jgi:intracellular sulfur oxidation DsrE/DsrF family protein
MEVEMAHHRTDPVARRAFLSRAGATATAAAIGIGTSARADAQTGSSSSPRFQPARHGQDDWFDALPGKHRLFLDAPTGPGAGDALLFAGNFLNTSKTGYSLTDSDNAVIVSFRHFGTPFAWNDAIWAKYGPAFTEFTKVNDPKTGKAPIINVYRAEGYGMQLNNLGTTIDALLKRGVQFAVCDAATHFVAGVLAESSKGDAGAIYKELVGNTIPGAHYVPAGIVATNRAQEHGYALAHCG